MEQKEYLSADDIKIRLLDYLTQAQENKNAVFANEVLFSQNKRRADLVYLLNETLTAFEIKSDLDNTNKLRKQISDYINTFDKVFVITTKKNLNQVTSKIKFKNVGILLYDGDFREMQEAKTNKVKKRDLVCIIDKNTLLRELKLKNRNISIDKIRNIAVKKIQLSQLKKISYDKLYTRYVQLFELFEKDRMKNTTIDDLLNLTGSIGNLR
jgi:predicted SpoU family rRNA methylase